MLEDAATLRHADRKREKNKRGGNNGRTEQNRKTEGRKEGKREAMTEFQWRIKKDPEGHPKGREDDQREALTVGGDLNSHKFYINHQGFF